MAAQRPNRGGWPPSGSTPDDTVPVERLRVDRGDRAGTDSRDRPATGRDGRAGRRDDPYPILEDLDEPDTHSASRGRDIGSIALIVGAIAFVLVAIAKPWGLVAPGQPAPSAIAVEGATAEPSTASASAVGGEAPVNDIPCVNDRVHLVASGIPASPLDLPDLPLTRSGGEAAYVASTTNLSADPNGQSHRVVVVARPGGTQTVATMWSQSPSGLGEWAQVRGWTPDGSKLLVAAGRSTPPADATCSNLFLVASDGSEAIELTIEGPGHVVVGSTFVAGGRYIAYLVSNYLDDAYGVTLQLIDLNGNLVWEGPSCRLDIAHILPSDSLLAVSPDGSHLAMLCPIGVLTIDLSSHRVATAFSRTLALRGAVGWSADNRFVFALEDPGNRGFRPLTIDKTDSRGLSESLAASVTTAAVDWEPVLGTSAFSPNGKSVLAVVCAEQSTGQCPERFAVLDSGTGQGRVVYDAPAANGSMTARWLPDSSHVAVATEEGGSVICTADGSLAIPTDLPADAAWWMPPAR